MIRVFEDPNNNLHKIYSNKIDSDKNSNKDDNKVDFNKVDPNEINSDENSDKDAHKKNLNKVDFNKVDLDEIDSDKNLDKIDLGKANDKANPNKVDTNKVDSNKFDSKKMDHNAVVTLGASIFKSNISNNVVSFCSSCSKNSSMPLTHCPNLVFYDYIISVLDALAYIPINKSSSVIAIDLAMKPLQLVIATNKEIAFKPILEHCITISFTLKKLSNTKFKKFSIQNL